MQDQFWRFFHAWLAKDGPFIDWLLRHLDEPPRLGQTRLNNVEGERRRTEQPADAADKRPRSEPSHGTADRVPTPRN